MIRSVLQHNHFIKIISFIIGYSLWAFIAQFQQLTITQQIPVCFYQTNNDFKISAPEHVHLSISGQRKNLHWFNPANSAIHLDASQYKEGTHQIQLSRENIFLPDYINMINLVPSSITIEVSKI